MRADDRERIALETAGWRRKELVGPSHPGVGKRRGVHRDRFASRMEAQHRRVAVTLAARVEQWADTHNLRPVLMVGPRAMIDAVAAALPTKVRSRVRTLPENLAQLSPATLHARVQPAVTRWQRDDEAARVEALLRPGGSCPVAVGLEQTLAALQECARAHDGPRDQGNCRPV